MSGLRQTAAFLLALAGAAAAPAQSTGVFREVFTGIAGNSVATLTNAATYPYGPAAEYLGGAIESPQNQAETFGERVRALVTIPTGGLYRFGIASDDASVLYLGTNGSPTGMTAIAWVNNWTGNRVFTTETNQQSALIPLSSGQVCYIEALHKEGGGSDNLCVRWILPDGSTNTPIPTARLAPYGRPAPVFTRQPASATVEEGGLASFTVAVQRVLNAGFAWRQNGSTVTSAVPTNLVYGPVTLADGGSTFACVVTNLHGVTTSLVAVLTVVPDATPPSLVGVQYLGDGRILLTFSELLQAAGASNLANYALGGGGTLTQAALLADGYRVLLVATGLTYDASFSLAVSGLLDRAASPHALAPVTQAVSQAYAPAPAWLIRGASEPPGPSSRRTPFAISEIHYHPAARADALETEFVELFNSAEWAEELGGYRLSGEVDYTFPSNLVLGARQYLVVAAVPADVTAAYGITNVLGSYTGRLSNGSGTVKLRGPLGEVLLEAEYGDEPPYPAAADGAGHSLVLARPSWGERDPRAWAASARVGGSPGAAEPSVTSAWSTVLINEVLAHTDDPQEDYIELFNLGTAAVGVAGCRLSDDVATNRYTIPTGTVLAARGFVHFTQSQLGFSLDAAGETVLLRQPDGSNVIDAVRFGPQLNGVPLGRQPDGAPEFTALSTATPAAPNAPPRQPDLVINEILYHPVTEDGRDEFVEIHNRSAAAVDLTGWRVRGGISFDFPAGAAVSAGGYVVVAADGPRLLATHPGLAGGAVFGNFAGALSDSGERIALDRPEELVSSNQVGQLVTNLVHVVEDEVTYGEGGRWGRWADGGGSSLELTEPAADRRRAANWADSDETAKSAWTTVEATGVLDNGDWSYGATQLHLLLLGAGECLVDNVQVIPQGGTNLVTNATFTAGVDGWVAQGTHEESAWSPAGGEGGGGALQLKAGARGDTGVNRARTTLSSTVTALGTATLRARVRWLKGHPELLLRLRGNWLEAAGRLLTTTNFGTPGAVNSRAVANAAPAIDLVRHDPVLPSAGQAVTVFARVQDADGVAAPLLRYRIDPSSATTTVAMVRRGGGVFSATIPGQAAGVLAAFQIEAADLRLGAQATARFPADAPAKEALVRWGDPVPAGPFGAYRLWLTQATAQRWAARDKNSNQPLDGTFICAGARPVYNMGCLYAGSPFHITSFNGPTNSADCDYTLVFPEDDRYLGATDFVLNRTSDDASLLRQRLAFWFAREMGLPYLNRRPIYLYVNGVARGGAISEDVQQPASDTIDEFFADDERGPLHKIEDWFEFQDDGVTFGYTTATLESFTSTGALKSARYRWNWRPRAVRGTANDFGPLFALVTAANAAAPAPYETAMAAAVDTRQWMRALAFERMTGNWDSYGYTRGKNMYAYKPDYGRWQLVNWDVDFSFGLGGGATDALDGSHDPVLAKFKNEAPFARQWWASLKELVDGPLQATRVEPWLDVRAGALSSNGVSVSGIAAMKTWLQSRRTYISSMLATSAAPLGVNGPAAFTTNANYVTLSGTAPVEVDRLTINGVAYAPTWTNLTQWRIDLPLAAGTNALLVGGVDAFGRAVTNTSVALQVVSTAVPEPAAGHVLISEIMYHAATSGASFIEFQNAAAATTYDLSRWTLPAIGLTVPDGTLLGPGVRLVFARDAARFAAAYGAGVPVAGVFTGELSNAGEWLRLIRPGPTTNEDEVIDEVEYDDESPWPSAADGGGPSLQLIDAAQDNSRSANWTSVFAAASTPGASNAVPRALPAFPPVWLNEIVVSNAHGATDNAGEREPWVELYNAGTAAVSLAGFCLSDTPTNLARWPFPTNAAIAAGGFLAVWMDGEPAEAQSNALHASFRVAASTGLVALACPGTGTLMLLDYLRPGPLAADRSFGSVPDGTACGRRLLGSPTPAAANDDSQPPLTLVINEWMADNSTTAADPADGDYEDWFELYNPTDFEMPLGGARLTDNAAQPTRFVVPAGYVVPPHGFLVAWADDETGQNSATNPALHVNFKLGKSGDHILLFASDGTPVDSVAFGAQVTDRSQGRLPDGSGAAVALSVPTPGAPNQGDMNHPPVLAPIAAQQVFRGDLLSMAVTATDTDQPPQALVFSLVAAPTGASVDAQSGLFTWNVPEAGTAEVEVVSVQVIDDGEPPLGSTQSFTVAVYPLPAFARDETNAAGQAFSLWTVPGHHYQVEYKEDLFAPEWTPLGDPFVGPGGWYEVGRDEGDEATPQRFYRTLEWP